jgi:hypothetical protein
VSDHIPLIVHISNEAGVQIGGIGAVLSGLLSAAPYHAAVARTVLAGPLQTSDGVAMERLLDPANGVQVAYSSYHGIYQGVQEEMRAALQAIERRFSVSLFYGTRQFGDFSCELLLADTSKTSEDETNQFKFACWEHFRLDSARHSSSIEYNQYMALASPLLAAIDAVGAGAGSGHNRKFLLAHDWLAIPVVLAAQIKQPGEWRTVFYAHETVSARRLVEEHSGHDTSFYNALFQAKEWNLSLEAVYGSQDHDHRHPLLRLATRCDAIFAVGDVVVDELRFLGGRFANATTEIIYNGSNGESLTLDEKTESRTRLQQYAERLLGYRPDYIFTHVSRMVLSKAFWRDLRLLDHLEGTLRKRGQSAVLFVLATSLPAGRHPRWVYGWEEQYGWPVNHRDDNGDLVGLESAFYKDNLLPFNERNRTIQGVFVNQFGWSRDRCGVRMPSNMTFADIRRGSDVEFGQSIYEPFGIPQVEALANGGLCCLSSMCGCIGFAARAAGSLARLPNLVMADYVTLPQGYWVGSPYDALNIDRGIRDWIEGSNSERAAHMLLARLPQSDHQRQALLESGCSAAQAMSWDTVVSAGLLPALRRVRNSKMNSNG